MIEYIKKDSYLLYIILFFTLSPIFMNLDVKEGINFDAFLNTNYNYPSIPISIIVLFFLSLFQIKYLIYQKQLMVLSFLLSLYCVVNIYYGNTRSIVVACGMILPIISYIVFLKLFNYNKNSYDKVFLTLFMVIVLKFITDIYFYNTQTIGNHYYGWSINKTGVSTIFFLLKNFVIYSYYDYFSYVYYLASVMSIYNLLNKKYIILSIVLIIISCIAVIDPGSRLFTYGIYLIPILILVFYIKKFQLKIYFNLFILLSVLLIILISLINIDKINDPSLLSRYNHIQLYFNDFSLIGIILPFINEHRISNNHGSFHNEFLEIFSFFGLVIIYYYFIIRNMFLNVDKRYELISYLLIFIIVTGGLIQLNLSNPYVGIITGMVLASLKSDESLKNE